MSKHKINKATTIRREATAHKRHNKLIAIRKPTNPPKQPPLMRQACPKQKSQTLPIKIQRKRPNSPSAAISSTSTIKSAKNSSKCKRYTKPKATGKVSPT
jgi:hypothetical protein